MSKEAYKILQTPMGVLRITADQKGVTGVHVRSEKPGTLQPEKVSAGELHSETSSAEEELAEAYALQAVQELTEYFAGIRTVFTVPLHEEGTPFQKRVWAALRGIPYGETRSYGQIAAQTGNPKAARAVGMANNRNPVMIITPCHRVIGADGSLVGFGGGLSMKKYLLELEKRR